MTEGIDPEYLFGNMALEARFITPDQLRLALGDQSRDVDQGKAPRQLGIILLARGWLTEVQVLGLLQDQAKRRALKKSGSAP